MDAGKTWGDSRTKLWDEKQPESETSEEKQCYSVWNYIFLKVQFSFLYFDITRGMNLNVSVCRSNIKY